MSRGQEKQVVDTAQQQNKQAASNAQQAYTSAQGDIGDYQDQLAKFAAGNPYGQGGEYQTSQDQVLSNTADATGQAAGQAMQSQAVRTGQNAGGAIAASEAAQQAAQRTLGSQEAAANANRISSEAGYNQDTLKASEVPATLQTALEGQQLNAQDQSLDTQQKAASTPSTADTVFGDVLSAASDAAGIATGGRKGCWIAARLFGGWDDPRTELVRSWIFGPLMETWYGIVPAVLYARYGEPIARRWMPKSRALTWALRRIFEAALRRAEKWEENEKRIARFRALQNQKAEVR
jgi:hypothetical protein